MGAATIMTACSTTKETAAVIPSVIAPAPTGVISGGAKALPHIFIYRMKADYSNLVPVTMNRERTEIVSYPAKSDIRPSAKPVALNDGWYLDRRGIGQNTVFTDYTYEQYANLEKTPAVAELMEHIIEKHPIIDLYDCGTKPLSIDELNELIGKMNRVTPAARPGTP